MSKQSIRLVGGVLALIGAIILAFAAYSYNNQIRTEQALEAQVPGQNTNLIATSTPIVLMPSLNDGNTSTLAPPNAAALSPSVTPLPTRATPVQPDATTAAQLALTPTAISLAPATSESGATATNVASASSAYVTPTVLSGAPKFPGVPRGQGSPATRLIIAKLNMDLSIKQAEYLTYQENGQSVSDWFVPYDAAGHLVTTAQPGEIGNAILSGHHNLVGPNQFGLGKFAGLWNLVAGDQIQITTEDGKTQTWRVDQSFPIKEGGEPLAVRIEHAQQIMADTPYPELTLLTCWNGKENPLSGNTYRWIIQAELIAES